ncbi:GIY-YIG nuclease family protein [Streptomyces sp. BPPL-273]|uniref:GIY-YIG nuclease family protein n=1 Tax=Streptomyces sp. BPPL-273 TaxID=2987533 RepID=UPI0024AEA3F4|nr:GIY-YIG nuclease family protein [Streptomyces sp. BPPL-273]WHM30252.1 GIY-YIG nuclease family protein [Streptomyces sp. BPPL-273]
MPEEVVYVLGTPGSNTVKIGRTANLAERFGIIQRMSPVPLSVLWQCPGNHELETYLHRHFASLRSHGEWFAFEACDPVQLIQAAARSAPLKRPQRIRRGSAKFKSEQRVKALRISPEARRRRGVGVAARAVQVRTLRELLSDGVPRQDAERRAREARQAHKLASELFTDDELA